MCRATIGVRGIGGAPNDILLHCGTPIRTNGIGRPSTSAMLRPAYLSQKLDRPLPTKDGGTLRTIREACDYMTAMDKQRELRQRWQRVAKLILAKENVLIVSRALELALFRTPSSTCQKSRQNESPGRNEFGVGRDRGWVWASRSRKLECMCRSGFDNGAIVRFP
jgi:hypothetical protein